MKKISFVLFAFLFLFASLEASQRRLIPFQGRLVDKDNVYLNGVYNMTFSIYNTQTGGSALWQEVHPTVSVIDGHVNILLGGLTDLDNPDGNTGTNDPVDFSDAKFLGITVDDGGQEMVPRHQLVPSFHAQTSTHAKEADHASQADNADKLDDHDSSYFVSNLDANQIKVDLANSMDAVNMIIDALQQNLVPPGTVMAFAGETVPGGWLLCDGTSYDPRESSQYYDLFQAIGDRYGYENAGPYNKYRVPDYRGYFLRGVDGGVGVDPDVSSRTTSGNGTSSEAGDNVGSKQGDALKIHSHSISAYRNAGAVYKANSSPTSDWVPHGGLSASIGNAGDSTESRPKNISVLYIIKY